MASFFTIRPAGWRGDRIHGSLSGTGTDPLAPGSRAPDVLVLGGGIAGLSAALAARRAGASVVLAEAAPAPLRGGNSRHGRNFRAAHPFPTPFSPGSYPEADFLSELRSLGTGGDPVLAQVLAAGSLTLPERLRDDGVALQTPAQGPLPWSRKTVFLLGGGTAMLNALYAAAARLGVGLAYETEGVAVSLAEGTVTVRRNGSLQTLAPRAVVVACGGFQADRARLRRWWGEGAEAFRIRGAPFATGAVLSSLLDQGAQATGDPKALHLVATDARSPLFDGGIVSRVDGISWGIVVDRHGRRIADEAQDIGPGRHTAWGRQVAACPGQTAWLIHDARTQSQAPRAAFAPLCAGTVEELAPALSVEPAALGATVAAFNAAPRLPVADGPRIAAVFPPKSRRALPLLRPPFAAFPICPGVTFTAYGLAVDSQARILTTAGTPCQTVFAAGAAMAPGILGTGYLAGAALTIGAVFGRIAGEGAARRAQS